MNRNAKSRRCIVFNTDNANGCDHPKPPTANGVIIWTFSASVRCRPGRQPRAGNLHRIQTCDRRIDPIGIGRGRARWNPGYVICPGAVETHLLNAFARELNPNDPEAATQRFASAIPTGCFSTPEEIATAVLFLCSDMAKNITGTEVVLDAGRTAIGGAPAPPLSMASHRRS